MVGHQTEQARGGVARLRERGNGADLHERKTQGPQRIERFGILVQAGGNAYRGGKLDPENRAGEPLRTAAEHPPQNPKTERQCLHHAQQGEGETMYPLGGKTKQ